MLLSLACCHARLRSLSQAAKCIKQAFELCEDQHAQHRLLFRAFDEPDLEPVWQADEVSLAGYCKAGFAIMPTSLRLIAATDLHRSRHHYAELAEVVSKHRPDVLALVGDFLDCIGLNHPQLTTPQCAAAIARLEGPEIVFVRGNHEDSNWWEFQDAWRSTGRKLVKLHGQAGVFGPAVIIGFPCYLGDDTAFAEGEPALPYDPGVWLSKLLKQVGPPMRTLWLMHETPAGTPLSNPNSPVAGNSDWNRAIERFSPLLTNSGHDHLTPLRTGIWHHRLGSTVCINVGQTDAGPLHYSLLESEFPGDAPSLPSRIRITAFPRNESIDVVGGSA